MSNKVPMRTCCGCRVSFPKKALIRIVRKPEGDVQIDCSGKMNGRGAYLCKNVECLKKARKSGSISRALNVSITEEIYIRLEKELGEIEA